MCMLFSLLDMLSTMPICLASPFNPAIKTHHLDSSSMKKMMIAEDLLLSIPQSESLAAQAWSPRLKQPECEKAMLFTGLYVVAAGVGGIKGSLPTHGAEQFDGDTEKGRRERSTFFNYFVFCLSTGGLIAVTFIVWIEDNKGWQWGFAASTISIAISAVCFISGSAFTRSKLPTGSPLTTIAKVLLAAIVNSFGDKGSEIQTQNPSDMLKFLNSAVKKNPNFQVLTCTVEELEEVKTVVRILPFFFSTVMLNCCLAQLSTFSVQQAATMNTKLGALVIPPASLPIFPVTFIIILAPIYNHFIIPIARKITKKETGITHLQRIGTGLVLSILAMAVAALVEIKRKSTAEKSGKLESTDHLPISFFWVAIQYLFLGSADLFTLAGLLEFFFTEAPWRMRSMATSLSWASLAMGYYLSSVLVEVVNGATSPHPWLSGKNLNFYRLERFYWLMAVLSALNFLQFLFWAARYNYRMPTDKA